MTVEPDIGDKLRVVRHLRNRGIPGDRILVDGYIVFNRESGKQMWAATGLSREAVRRNLVRHPDVMVLGECAATVRLICEIDGGIHSTRPGMRQTEKRNRAYGDAKIPYIVIDKADLALTGQSWEGHIDAELERLGIAPLEAI